jgi:hypothetical protein
MSRIFRSLPLLVFLCCLGAPAAGDESLDKLLPVRGLCMPSPRPARVDDFVKFIDEQLVPRAVNVLVLRVDYGYKYASHPEVADPNGLTREQVGKIGEACRKAKIQVIPQINLLGHQSWASRTGRLLQTHPDFDETPWVKMPERYAWPNPDRLYCKSYCPRHPQVHEVVFALVDELCDAFQADAFHAGLDEVFYIGEEKCPRCGGRDKAQLFADEVKLIRDHLDARKRKLWIWGDRLLEGKVSGLGEWEASTNGTDRAVDLIPKDVIICDWHYDRAVPTPAYFALKGLNVVICPWRKPAVATTELQEMLELREQSTPQMKGHLLGVMQTVWSSADGFMDEVAGKRPPVERKGRRGGGGSEGECFKALFDEVGKLKGK